MIRRAPFLALLPLFAACSDGGGGSSPTTSATYNEQVGAILNAECVSCHVAGGIAPFSLATYAEAAPLAASIKSATASRRMPPWAADDSGSCGTFKDDKFLLDSEIALLGEWADAGAPEGPPAVVPTPPPAESLARVDSVIDMGTEYSPNPAVADDFRCFVVDPALNETRFLTGYQVHPGDLRVVHHIILYGLSSSGEAAVIAADDADPAPGYGCSQGGGIEGASEFGAGMGMDGGGAAASNQRWLAAWAPGDTIGANPPGTGLRLDPGRKMMMQIHYNLAQGSWPDRTTIDLMHEATIGKEAFIIPIPAPINLPPGEPYVETTQAVPLSLLPSDVLVYGFGPHMHQRGRTQKVELETNGAVTCLLDAPRFNFRWQNMYQFDEPKLLQKAGGSKLHLTCGYDTQGDTQTIVWGEGTEDEMCLAVTYVTLP